MGRPGTKQARLAAAVAAAGESLWAGGGLAHCEATAEQSQPGAAVPQSLQPGAIVRHSAKPGAEVPGEEARPQGGDLAIDPGDPEGSYLAAVPLAHRRRFGQFFTPPAIADLMSEWVAEITPRRLLDPAVGPGVLVRACRRRLPLIEITAIDRDGVALDAARQALRSCGETTRFIHHDFLTWPSDETFDAIIANPPYLRHHDLLYEHDIFAAVGARSGVRLSRLSNIYVLFILEICRRLRPGGRAAVIVPGEWVNANFGMPLKRHLLERGLLRSFVYFSHASLIFDDALTTASVLFIERPATGGGAEGVVKTIFAEGGADIGAVRLAVMDECEVGPGLVVRRLDAKQLAESAKWNHLLQHGPRTMPPGFVRLGELARSCRGIATGANGFFHVSRAEAARLGISERHLRPCVGRAADVESPIFDRAAFVALAARGRPTCLLDFGGPLSAEDLAYLAEGEARGLPRRYLLAARSPWYAMEERPPAPIWAATFGRGRLRFIWNAAGVHNLTCFHCIYPHDERPHFATALVACLNSAIVQDACRAQQRVYGGGLLKFEPKDLLEIAVPDLRGAGDSELARLAERLHTGVHLH